MSNNTKPTTDIEELSFGNAVTHRKQQRPLRKSLIILLCTLLVAGAAGGCWYMWTYHWRTITITINGNEQRIRVDTNISTLLNANNAFNAKPGRLLDVTNETIEPTGGEPIHVTVNGNSIKPADRNRTTFPDNATVTVESGKDLTEDHTIRKETVPYKTEITLSNGPLQEVTQRGQHGVRETWIGKRTGKEADRGITQEPKNLIIQSRQPQPAGRKVIALTFDDGPSKYSNAILDILKNKGAKATFFDVGQNAIDYASAEQRMIAEGHQVASHSNTHTYLPKLSDKDLRAELQAGFKNLKEASGVETKIMRAPYGAFGADEWRKVADMVDMNVMWSIDTLDWTRPGAKAIHDSVVNNAHNGAVVLMHDGGGDRSQDVEALPGIIDDLKSQGYEFVTIDQLRKL